MTTPRKGKPTSLEDLARVGLPDALQSPHHLASLIRLLPVDERADALDSFAPAKNCKFRADVIRLLRKFNVEY
jgi:hypothetical protein